MDQVKIGKFIADLRREREMTQKELAEQVGVSDKAVSKWECGNGMPEISILMPLCQTLQVNVNELLSGERLSNDNYSEKAEENIMHLIQENEEARGKHKRAVLETALLLGLSVCIVLGGVLWLCVINNGTRGNWQRLQLLIDLPTLITIAVIVILTLAASGLWKAFFRAFGILAARKEYSVCQIKESAAAWKLAGNMQLFAGLLVTVFGLISMLWYVGPVSAEPALETWRYATILADYVLLGVLYGVIGKMLLLPIQSRLEILAAGE